MVSRRFVCYIVLMISTLGEMPACAQKVPRRIRNTFAICASRDTLVSNRVETSGYYAMNSIRKERIHGEVVLDTIYDNMIFYPDGFWVYNVYGRSEPVPGDMEKYLQEVINGTNERINTRASFYKWSYWGLYKVVGDTITGRVIYNGGYRIPGHRWSTTEYKFIMRSSQTLELLKDSIREVSKPTKSDVLSLRDYYSAVTFLPAVFVPFSHIPPSADSWLKKQPWIWCEK